ncbi:MAG TPA: SigE family RNA polymerase sigma factor, partial [Jatrophihabitantaceae bacterium]|nr:SigE family RNA polymerase sigma factor [Jatrophihabitantaceae bacterium]
MDVELGFAEFVQAQTAALLRTAYLLTGNGHSAEELVQDTLVRLFGKWDRVQAAEQPLAYVRRALANAYINDRRRASSREIRLDVIPERVDVRDMTGRIADRDELWPLLLALPNRQRAAIVLRYYSDLSDAEIAAALDCRVGTVRSLISRGLATMRQSTDGTTAAGRTS